MNYKSIYAVIAASFIAYTPASYAQAAENNNIAVVDIQSIMKKSTAAKSVREQLEKKQKAFQAEITKKEDALKKEDKELGKQRNVLAKDAFEKKVRAFRKKATAVQKEVRSKKALLDNAFERSLGDIQKATTDIIADIAKEKGFVIAIPTSQVLYADNKLDISDEVLKRLNKKHPKLNVKFK